MIALFTDLWMRSKRARSQAQTRPEREPLPKFRTVRELADYLASNFIYTGDPLDGADDRYEHPETLNYWIVKNMRDRRYGDQREWPLKVDCDDVSAFAYKAATTIPEVANVEMLVFRYRSVWAVLRAVLDDLLKRKRPYLYFHEGCLIETWGGTVYLLDTQGLTVLSEDDEHDGVEDAARDAAAQVSSAVKAFYGVDVPMVAQFTDYPF